MLGSGLLSAVLVHCVVLQSMALVCPSTFQLTANVSRADQALSAFPVAAFRRPGDPTAAFIESKAAQLSEQGQSRRLFLRRIIGLGGSALLLPLAAFAQAEIDGVLFLSGWATYFNADLVFSALRNYGNKFGEIAIFAVQADSKGNLVPAADAVYDELRAAKNLQPRQRVLLTVTNDQFIQHGRGKKAKLGKGAKVSKLIHRWTRSPEAREAHIKDLMKWAEQADGLDIDYENIAPTDGANFVLLIQELSAALHAKTKYLSVIVEPKTQLAGHYLDWKALGVAADRVRIMAYQYHGPKTEPGAVSPPADVKRLAQLALTSIPANKVEISLPVYGFDWIHKVGKRKKTRWFGRLVGRIADFIGLRNRGDLWGSENISRDPDTNSSRFTYMSGIGKKAVEHQVWFEDPASIVYKIKMLMEMGIWHIGLWQLGVGDISELFKLLPPSAKPSPIEPGAPEITQPQLQRRPTEPFAAAA